MGGMLWEDGRQIWALSTHSLRCFGTTLPRCEDTIAIPGLFPFHRMLWKTQICSSMGVALQCFSIPFQFFLCSIRHHRESRRTTISEICLPLCLRGQELLAPKLRSILRLSLT